MQKETKVVVFMFVSLVVLMVSAWEHSWLGIVLGVLMFLAMLTYASPEDTRKPLRHAPDAQRKRK